MYAPRAKPVATVNVNNERSVVRAERFSSPVRVVSMSTHAQTTDSRPYQVSDDARQLSSADMAFIANYTGRPVEELKQHIMRVWQAAKQKVSCRYIEKAHCINFESSCSNKATLAALGVQVHPTVHVFGAQDLSTPILSASLGQTSTERWQQDAAPGKKKKKKLLLKELPTCIGLSCTESQCIIPVV